jgi:23S rRNA (cytosine1962-C5)-methyltransferase
MELNSVSAPCDFIRADIFQYLRDTPIEADLIILDPPALAKNRASVDRACRGYKDLNLLAFKLLRPGGLLFTFSCSGGVSAELFQKVVAGAAADAGREAQLLAHLGPGADHPALLSFPEGEYLKGLVVRCL